MIAKRLANGRSAYFWNPSKRDRDAGCAMEPAPLGADYGAARARALELNEGLDAWRAGRGGEATMRRAGTVEWWLQIYRTKTRSWSKLRPRTQEEYARHLRILVEFPLSKPQPGRKTIGDLPVMSMTPAAVDRLYERLVAGDAPRLKPNRVRQAALEIDIMKIAWRAVQRHHPEVFPAGNPFEGLTRESKGSRTKKPATAAEVYALAEALREAGHPHLGACALICFEWHQRPENVLAGATTWTGYRPGESVRIEHWKTRGARAEFVPDDERYFWLSLSDGNMPLYPEIEAYLADLKRLGTPMVLMPNGKPTCAGMRMQS